MDGFERMPRGGDGSVPEESKKTKAEARYVKGRMSLKALAEETGVQPGTLKNWCRAGKWTEKRKEYHKNAGQEAAIEAENKKARELHRLTQASDEVESALLLAARAIARNMDADTDGLLVTDGKERAGNLSRLTQAIGRQTMNRMLLSGILSPADEEKAALQRRKQKLEEEKSVLEQTGQGAEITLAAEAEDLAE